MRKRFNRILSILLVHLLLVSCISIDINANAYMINLHESKDTSTNWVWPTSNHTLKSDWPNYSSGSYHGGTDFPVALDTPVYSSCDGEVVLVKSLTTSYGKHIKIKAVVNGETVYIRYCHLNSFAVSEGDKVSAGQLIAYSGSTGNSTGPHLHYEVRNSNDTYGSSSSPNLNPKNYLPGTSYSFQTNSPQYLDLGTDFYAYIINTSCWKHLTNDYDNVCFRTETGEANQVWKFERQGDGSYKIINCGNGKVLDVETAGSESGLNVHVWESTGGSNQKWYLYGESAAYYLKPQCSDCVLDLNTGEFSEGVNAQIWTKNNSEAQKFQIWTLTEPRYTYIHANLGTDFYAYLINDNAWKMASEKNENVELESETAYRNQFWYFERQNDYSYKITNIATGKCLDVEHAGIEERENVHVYESTDANNQRWYLSSEGNDTYLLHPKNAPGMALDVSEASTQDGANIQLWSINHGDAQRFRVWKFDNTPAKPTVTSSIQDYKKENDVLISWGENSFATSYWVDIWLTSETGSEHTESFETREISYTIKNVSNGKYGVFVTACNQNGTEISDVYNFNVPYTVTFNANGGTGTIAAQAKIYGENLILSSTKPTRTGYQFLGWSTDKNATAAQYQPGGKYTENTSTTLYAIWKEYKYELSGWTWNGTSSATANFTCKDDSSQNKTVNAIITSKTTAATCETAGKTVYTATATFNSKTYTDKKEVTISSIGHSYKLTGWNWNGYDSATATFTCENDSGHKKTIDAEITRDTTDGSKIVYTAAVTFEGKEYSDTKTELITQNDSDVLITSDTDTGKDQSSDVGELSDTEKESDTNDNSESDEDLHDDSDTEQDSDESVDTESNTDSDSDITSDLDSESDSDNNSNSDDDSNQVIPGDINGDGKVNMKDVTRLHQYINGWDVFVNDNYLDINGDGKINMKDLTRLHQFINGWNVEIH